MGQLIKYFESQSRRLDRQTFHSHPPSFNPDFESLIKFNGVPILPPAITSSRRNELRQYKKDAVLLEKRQKAKQRRQLLAKADSLVGGSQVTFPETGSRPTARQLNFDSGEPVEGAGYNDMHGGLGATDPRSTFATAETGMVLEDFGLQTMDSVNSDFMTLEEASIPRVFNGLVLTSVKEQKISYDLDRLSKALNVQDLTSTSGSDLSDALGNTQTLEEEDLQSARKLAEKFLTRKALGDGSDAHSASFFHESQDTVVEVSPEPGGGAASGDNTSTSGFVENTNSSNLEQTHNSLGSSPGCGSANTTATTDSQRSSRSSPKSLKNAVHFASFVTEYINTSASQSFERPTIVKKKISSDQIHDSLVTGGPGDGAAVLPIIGDPSEAQQRHSLSRKVSDEGTSGMLDKVSFNLDSDASPLTPPFDAAAGVPFQMYGRSEAYGSDKENDAWRIHKDMPQGHKKLTDHGSRGRHHSNEGEVPDTQRHGGRHRRASGGDKPPSPTPGRDSSRNRKGGEESKNTSSVHYGGHHHSAMQSSMATAGVGPQDLQSMSSGVGASQVTASSSDSASASLVSVSQSSEAITTGIAAVGKTSVSDSQGSNKSNTLTGTSESSSSTIREDFSARDSANLALNIVDTGNGSVDLDTDARRGGTHEETEDGEKDQTERDPHSKVEPSHSPKKLNTDTTSKESHSQDSAETPPRPLVRSGSYTLSEPSPALVKARSRLEAAKKQKQQEEAESSSNKPNEIKHSVAVEPTAQKKTPAPASGKVIAPSDVKVSVPSGAEREGKAEHINKYLNQVQFQNSMNFSSQSWDVGGHESGDENEDYQDEAELNVEAYDALTGEINDDDDHHMSVLDVLRSIAESQGSLEHLTVEELLALHHQQMEEKRQALINQQQRDMEELFVQQRREVMLLESEIKAAQQQEKEQQEFLIQNAPENIKVKARNHDGEYSPEHTGNFDEEEDHTTKQRKSVIEDSMNSLDNMRPQSFHRMSSSDHSSVPSLKLQPKSYPGMTAKPGKPGQGKQKSQSLSKKSNIMDISPGRGSDDNQTHVKTIADDSFSPRANPPMDTVGLANRIPEFSPSTSSPRIHRTGVLRSPLKYTSLQKRDGRVVVPPEAYYPEMQVKFDKVSAVAKGFLTRCLLRSDKVQELIKTIKDTREFAFKFQTETPIKKGVFTSQDRGLLERIVAQLQAALLDIHEIFFEIPSLERMALIEQTRIKELEKRVKASRDSMRASEPRISQATLKALERKRKAREAEASAMLSTSRPRTAPPATSSPRCQNHTDISGPLRRHFGYLISRALKPIQGQSHGQVAPMRQDTSRSEKGRPQTAPEKQLTRPKRITATSSKPALASAGMELNKDNYVQKESTSKQATTVISRPVMKSKVAPSKPSSSRPTKSWR